MHRAVDRTGQRFGRLLAVERIAEFKKRTKYRCTCDCGNEVVVDQGNLRVGNTESCGCRFLEVLHRRKQPDDEIRLNAMYRDYKRRAKVKGIVWGLTVETFRSLVKSVCDYCGYSNDKTFIGVDRVDNNLGYTPTNSAPCCRWCNWGKNERTLQEFQDWIDRLHARRLFHSR